MTQRDESISGERRVGRRAEQKRRWDRDHYVPDTRRRDAIRARAAAKRGRIAELWRQGATLKEIAADLGTTDGTVAAEVHRMRCAGWDLPRRQRFGVR